MANKEHLDILAKGVPFWNNWRNANPLVSPDLNEIQLGNIDLTGVNFSRANLRGAGLYSTILNGANLSGVDLLEAKLKGTKLQNADLSGSRLMACYLNVANLNGADLRSVNFMGSVLIGVFLERAHLSNCLVYGLSAWDLFLDGATQENLIITPPDSPSIEVDNLEVAQFIYLLLNNQKIRDVIDTITSKVVLILGRFAPERKIVLDGIRDALANATTFPFCSISKSLATGILPRQCPHWRIWPVS